MQAHYFLAAGSAAAKAVYVRKRDSSAVVDGLKPLIDRRDAVDSLVDADDVSLVVAAVGASLLSLESLEDSAEADVVVVEAADDDDEAEEEDADDAEDDAASS